MSRLPIGAVMRMDKNATVNTSIPYSSNCFSPCDLAVSKATDPMAAYKSLRGVI
ncbi:unnamed protein product [Gulo gulo]|uniref:Uncharacterized protein n=1 Tax=Gulo gulo TaxID=48420 RepID=A0A9X9Q835_GULGU|nr:unnamed protein product [Gulo gulo]